jgi:two-component sensor histidine kinase
MQMRAGLHLLTPKMRPRYSAQLLIFLLGVLLVSCCLYLWRTSLRTPRSVNESFKNSDISNWKAFGGSWTASEEGIKNDSDERGAKLVSGDPTWKDYALDADVQLLGHTGDVGVIIRSNEEAIGVNAYSGYYVGLRNDPNTIFIGRADHGYVEYQIAKIPGGVRELVWYHLRVVAVGCEITGVASDPSSGRSATVAMKDLGCTTRGRIGLRSYSSGGLWKNIQVRPVEPNETKQLTHSLELFCGTILLLLLCLSMYVMAEHWRLTSVLEERTRVAREIHDTLAQSFSAIALQLESIVREPGSNFASNQNVELALDMATQSRKEAHVTIAALRNLSLELSLAEIIEKAASAQLGSKQIRFSLSTQVSIPRLPADVETQLFRIAQEAITNAAQHSGASEIAVDFNFENRVLVMIIKDNGSGFRLDKSPGIEAGHYGIVGMRERASAINATCTISSNSSGSSIAVLVPLRPSHGFLPHLLSSLRDIVLRRHNQNAKSRH